MGIHDGVSTVMAAGATTDCGAGAAAVVVGAESLMPFLRPGTEMDAAVVVVGTGAAAGATTGFGCGADAGVVAVVVATEGFTVGAES